MSFDAILSGLSNIALHAPVRDDDGVDQLNHFFTVSLLTFFGAICGLKEYATDPINCWNDGDTYFWVHYQQHVNDYCWSHSMYHYPNKSDRNVVPYGLDRKGGVDYSYAVDNKNLTEITFYRWVTVFFVTQAILFKIPNILWRELNAYTGSNIVKMVEMLQSVLFASDKEKKDKLQQVALFLEQWLRMHRKPHWFIKVKGQISRRCNCCTVNVEPTIYGNIFGLNAITDGAVRVARLSISKTQETLSCCMLCVGNNMDNYLSTVYLLVKALYVTNVVMQILLLSAFLQLSYWQYGVDLLKAYGDPSVMATTTSTFPTIALCHFQVYDRGNATGRWVQCHLSINLILEKLFLIEWFWLLLLLCITSVNCLLWVFRLLRTQTAINFVQRYMRLMGIYTMPTPITHECSVEQFVTEYLRNDGVLILRILAVNTNEVVMAEFVEELWIRYVTMFARELAVAEAPF